jgi:two-component system osmolarity sensor histidine kinase EnvZ
VTVSLTANVDHATVAVFDQGSGVLVAEVDRLLRPFERGETARSGSTGAGLGLPIVDRIARMHSGSLRLLPNSPRGLRAELTLAR